MVKESSGLTFYVVSLIYMFLVIISALIIDDLTLIFGMIAACSESTLNFVFPGLIYLLAKPYLRAPAVIFVMIGATYFIISNYFNVIKMK